MLARAAFRPDHRGMRMRSHFLAALALGMLVVGCAQPAPQPAVTTKDQAMQIGKPAPDFAVQDETGTVRKLADFRGKTLVLWFYPKADTPG